MPSTQPATIKIARLSMTNMCNTKNGKNMNECCTSYPLVHLNDMLLYDLLIHTIYEVNVTLKYYVVMNSFNNNVFLL